MRRAQAAQAPMRSWCPFSASSQTNIKVLRRLVPAESRVASSEAVVDDFSSAVPADFACVCMSLRLHAVRATVKVVHCSVSSQDRKLLTTSRSRWLMV